VIQAECSLVKHLGELDEGKLHVQFDVEGAGEILSFTLPKILAHLLRADLIAECYVPSRDVRLSGALLTHRVSITREQTRIKWRIILHG